MIKWLSLLSLEDGGNVEEWSGEQLQVVAMN